jgi:pimeloyl-ACP methyl ester carboxylesterase
MIGDVEVRHHRMDRDGVGLHYVTAGHGPPLVLVHGFLGTWWAWRRVIPRLTEDYRVIAVDMRGYGDSDKPVRGEDPGFGYDSRNLAEDLRCVMRDAHVDAPTRVIEHDMGAPACLTWAARYPAEVSHLAYLEEPTPGFTIESITAYTANNGHPAWWFQFNAVPELPETLIRGREREFLSWFYDAFATNRAALDDGIEEYLRTFAAPGGISGALGWYRALRLSEQQTREDCASSWHNRYSVSPDRPAWVRKSSTGSVGSPRTSTAARSTGSNTSSPRRPPMHCSHNCSHSWPDHRNR